MLDPTDVDTAIATEVEEELVRIQQDPSLFAPYDLDGSGDLDASELERLRVILTAKLRTARELASSHDTSTSPHSALEGARVCERYTLLSELGRGGQAATFVALDEETNERVVVKQLHMAHLDNWKAIELFEREGEVLSQLEHRDIPTYLGAHHEQTDGGERFLLIQEYVEGDTLAQLLGRGHRFTEQDVEQMLHALLDILIYLQSLNPPVIHRDIKPSNIIRRADGTWALIDFGAIQAVLTSASMIGSTIVGTSGYMAPEQFMGRSVPATDLYALGATAIHALSHTHPSELPLVRMRLDYHPRVNISTRLRDFLDELVAPNIEDRFVTAKDAKIALTSTRSQLVKAPPTELTAPSPQTTEPGGATQGGVVLAVVGVVALVGVFFVGIFLVRVADEPPEYDPGYTVDYTSPTIDINELMPTSEPVAIDPSTLSPFELERRALTERFNNLPKKVTSQASEVKTLELIRTSTSSIIGNSLDAGYILKNTTDKSIDKLVVEISLLDDSGERISSASLDAHPSYMPPARPGDPIVFNESIEELPGDAKELVIHIVSAETSAPKELANELPLVEIKWLDREHRRCKIEARARVDKVEAPPYMGDQRNHDLDLEIRNISGCVFDMLKLEKRMYNKAGDVFEIEDSYVNGVYDPTFLEGEVRLVSINSLWLKQKPTRYEIVANDVRIEDNPE